jgi:hypothetical protein
MPTGSLPGPARDLTTASLPRAVSAAPEQAAPEHFVAVVFTHKDKAAALEAFADLQRRYASVLRQHRGELQEVDAGNKGIWHRVVVLPAGTREQARAVCQNLTTAGYDRCWIKPY